MLEILSYKKENIKTYTLSKVFINRTLHSFSFFAVNLPPH
jgi:hypothetical protein